MGNLVNRQQAEDALNRKFQGKFVRFSYPGRQDVYGLCSRIAIGTGIRDQGLIQIIIQDRMYTCSPESFKDCLTLIKRDGDTRTIGADAPEGSR